MSENLKYLKQAAIWGESKWGYLRNFPGLKFRIKDINEIKDHFYIVTYGDHAVGMFAVLGGKKIADWSNKSFPSKELEYVYVDEPFRGLGIGKKIIQEAKKIAHAKEEHVILLQTLNPNLNSFYKKHGAKEVGEQKFLEIPTEVLAIS